MLVAPRARQLSRTLGGLLGERDKATMDQAFAALIEPGLEAMQQEGVAREAIAVQPSVDLRYRGQSYYLNVPWQNIDQATADFHAQHEQRYGHRLTLPVELVNLRVALQRPPRAIGLQAVSQGDSGEPYEYVDLHAIETPVPVYARADLVVGQTLRGPALITETVSTTYLAPDWQARVHETGCLLLNRR